MTHQALYRKWRPMVFEDIVGQGHITKTLKNQIMTGRIGHAYLFCGTRGTGKTTCAKVLSRAVNCLNNHDGSPCNECEICRGIIDGSILDVTEIDAASNNGVDNIREIRDDVRYVATTAKYTVYIIDEVHMLSGGAFNALLKTLEEPPEHVIFILATTEPQKVPQTILSRCQRFDFKRIKPADIILRMKEIAHGDGLDISDDAYTLLARLADGSMRDGLSYLERVVSSCGSTVTAKDITDTLGISTLDGIYAAVDAIINCSVEDILKTIETLLSDGKDLRSFIDSLIKYFRDLMILKVSANAEETLDYSAEELVKIKGQCSKITFEKISHAISVLSDAQTETKFIKAPRVIYELALIKLAKPEIDMSQSALNDRIASIEQKLKGTSLSAPVQSSDKGLEKRLEAIEEKLKNGSTVKTEKKEDAPPPKKKEVSKRLYNPIPADKLNSEFPMVKIAKNWSNTVRAILSGAPHLTAPLINRDITIDADGIILLYKKEENLSKNLAARYMADIKKGFYKATGSDCQIKVALYDDLNSEDIIDFWDLKPPAPPVTDNAAADNSLNNNENQDPLDSVLQNFPEIIDTTDEREFLNYGKIEENFSQSSFDDDKEEFLESKEVKYVDDEDE